MVKHRISEAGAGKVGSVLIIGGGIGGIQAALDLAESGFKASCLRSWLSAGGISISTS
jgi:heterodisulfide reductase subunit A